MFKKLTYLRGRFGMEPLFPISHDHTKLVNKQYKGYIKRSAFQLDDITWSDLDLDEVYQDMNATYSGAGDIALYGMLRTPCVNQKSLQKRYDLMKWAMAHEEEREDVIECLYEIGKRYGETMDQVFLSDHSQPKRGKHSLYLVFALLLSIPFSILFPNPCGLLTIGLLLYDIGRATIIHKKLEKEVNALVYVLAHMKGLHQLAKMPFTGLLDVSSELQEMSKKLSDIRSKFSLNYFEKTMNAINFIFQSESIYYDRYASIVHQRQGEIKEAIAYVGMIDACIAVASYAVRKEVYLDLSLDEKGAFIEAKNMVHPLLNHPVANDIDIHENRMITGSNATGKSTYLKMVALNAILAQSFHFVFAKAYHASFFQIATSMSLVDNLQENKSTFVAEVKSLTYLLSLEHKEIPTLCMIDEILRGTNTQERIAASSVILNLFAQRNYLCLSATHDMELTKILASLYQNYYFTETMKDGNMLFDYKIHKGASKTRNAIQLLTLLGYKDSLTKQAKRRLQNFENSGNWETIG